MEFFKCLKGLATRRKSSKIQKKVNKTTCASSNARRICLFRSDINLRHKVSLEEHILRSLGSFVLQRIRQPISC